MPETVWCVTKHSPTPSDPWETVTEAEVPRRGLMTYVIRWQQQRPAGDIVTLVYTSDRTKLLESWIRKK